MNNLLSLIVLFLTLIAVQLNGQKPVTYSMIQQNERFYFEPGGQPVQEIQVCGLEKGKSYSIEVLPQTDNFQGKLLLGEKVKTMNANRIRIQAKAPCVTFYFSGQAEGEISLPELWISVASLQMTPLQSIADKFPGMEVAPLEVNPNFSATELVEDIFIGGGCFEVSNITQIGADAGLGYFSNGMSSIGLEDGVILATGNVTNAQGPNSGGGTGNSLNQPGDPDLAALSGVNSNDAHGIEFDFTPTLDEIQFRFAFASDEYCEYVNQGVNDAFGFFISGPGINGPYSGNAANIALIPGTNTAVSINTVNHLQNTMFFKSNSQGCGNPIVAFNDIEYDGMTTVLVATANVIPCETYHIKLVVGDGGDFIFDSAVFLQANSFEAGGDASVMVDNPITGSNVIYEGCGETFLVFEREDGGDLSMPLDVEYTIDPASTATPGVDYTALPPIITIPAGQTQVIIPITAFLDGITEGPENILIQLASSCSCESGSAEIIIEEAPEVTATMDDVEACGPEVITLAPVIDGGVPLYGYNWSDGSTSPSITVTPTVTTTYTVTITDACGASTETSATVSVTEQPTATLSGYGVLCNNNNSVELQVDFTGDGPWDLYYLINGVLQTPILGITTTPYFFTVSEPGSVSLFSVSTEGCEGMTDGFAQVDITDIQLSVISGDVSCEGGNNGFVVLIPLFGNEPLSYEWSNGDQSQNLTDIEAGEYFVTVTDFFGCTAETDVIIEDGPEFIAQTLLYQPVSCYQGSDGAVGVIVTNGGSGSYTYDWSNGGNSDNLTQLPSGLYTVTVTDLFNCADTVSIELTDPPELLSEIIATDTVDCSDPAAGTIDLEASGGTGTLNYSWSNGSAEQDPTGLEAGSYTVVITDENGCLIENSAEIFGNFDLPEIEANVSNTLDCANPEASLDGSGSSSGPPFVYSWTTPNGNIVSGDSSLIAVANAPGVYTLTVYNSENSCFSEQTVFLGSNFVAPLADAGIAQQISCSDNSLTLDGSGSAQGPTYQYAWTTAGGNIVSGNTTLTPVVNAAGWYFLTVLDISNGCSSVDSVEVTQDSNLPTVNAGPGSTLTCSLTEYQLNGSVSTVSGNEIYNWVTPDGNIVSGDSTLTPVVNAPGVYQLQVTDLGNGCSAVSSVTIQQDTASPIISFQTPDTLDCLALSVGIDATDSENGINFVPAWSTADGVIQSGDSTFLPAVNAPGLYIFTLYNTFSNCLSVDTVVVVQDVTNPIADAGADSTLTCLTTSLALDGSNSSNGSEFTYLWNSPDGLLDSGANQVDPVVSTPGTYEILVTNTQNGCTATDQVLVGQDIVEPSLALEDPEIINCYNPEIILNASGSATGTQYSYLWTTSDGNIVQGDSTLQPEVNAPGDYTLVIENQNNGCITSTTVSVLEDVSIPLVDAGLAQTLDCSVNSLLLNGSGSNAGSTFSYAWSTPDGNILAGGETLTPEVDEPGTYNLTITNTENGCSASAQTIIFESLDLPTAVASVNELLTCTQLEINLDGSGSATGDSITYLWTTNQGILVSGESSLMPVVGAPGSYFLTVYNQANSCDNTVEVIVEQDITPPVVSAGSSQELTCTITEVTLDGTGSDSGPTIVYSWSSGNGNIVSGAQTLNPTVNEPGNYALMVTNTENGCTATEEVTVTIDANVPQVDAGQDAVLTCAVTTLSLDGSGSVINDNMLVSWNTQDGNINAGATTLNPEINAPGTYVLTVEDTTNSCVASATVLVTQDIAAPVINIAQPSTLTCTQTTLQLDATGSDSGPTFNYSWSTTGGVLVGGQNTGEPTIAASGVYELILTNTQNGCSATGAVTVMQDLDVPNADAGVPTTLTCATTQATVGGTGSSTGSDFSYQWTTSDGNIVSNPQQLFSQVDAPGTYQLVVTNNSNGCTALSVVEIDQDVVEPMPVLSTPDLLTCDVLSTSITATSNTANNSASYSWTTSNGSITGAADLQQIDVSAPGTYVCLVTDLVNGCTASVLGIVNQNIQLPQVDAGPAQTITCNEPTVTLDGSNSSSGNFAYLWSTQDGNILSGISGVNPVVDAAGTYTLLVTNTLTGCSATDQVSTGIDTTEPIAAAGTPATLNCALTTITLNGAGSSQGADFEYAWTTVNGNILSGATTLQPNINQAGTYVLLVTNTQNGCSSTDQVVIDEDTTPPSPLINAPQGLTLTCAVNQLPLDGGISLPSGLLSFEWTTSNGVITGAPDATIINAAAGGNYQLEVTNSLNGCTATTSVQIGVDTLAPYITIATPEPITCLKPQVELNAGNSASGPGITYAWSAGSGGTIVSGATTSVAIAGSTGSYNLTIENSNNGCTSSASTEVIENIDLPQIVVSVSGLLNCNQPEVIVSGVGSVQGPSYTYLWETQDGQITGNPSLIQTSVSQVGTYSLTIYNQENGCENTATVNVEENTNFPTSISYNLEQPVCYGEEGLLEVQAVNGGVSPYQFSFDGGETWYTGFGDLVLASGTYEMIVRDGNGCTYAETFFIAAPPELTVEAVEPEVKVNLGETGQLQAQVNFSEDLIDTIMWSPIRFLSCTNCLNPVVESASVNTPYTIQIRTVDGCLVETTIFLRVIEKRDIFIPNAFTPFDNDGRNDLLLVYANDRQVSGITRFEIFDRWGERVFADFNFQPNDPGHSWDGYHKGQQVTPGVYVYFAEIEFVDGEVLIYKGSVTVVR